MRVNYESSSRQTKEPNVVDLIKWILSDFWAFLGCLILLQSFGSVVKTIAEAVTNHFSKPKQFEVTLNVRQLRD